MNPSKTTIAVALSALMLTAGCVGSQLDDDLESTSSGSQADLSVTVEATNLGDVQHMGLVVDGIFAHEANASADKYQPLDVTTDHADVVNGGASAAVPLASGSVSSGSYDELLLRLSNATAETGSSSDGHDHGDGADGHDHGDSKSTVTAGSADLPIPIAFEATAGEETSVTITIDADATVGDDTLTPSIASVEVTRGDEMVASSEDIEIGGSATRSSGNVSAEPPAARMAVFAPNGNQIYKPAFDPKDDEFVNSKSSAFEIGADVRFSGTESEAVARGATLDSYEWDFDDGNTATGSVATHAFEEPGVYEVTLTVEDSNGEEATHTTRIVTWGWTKTAVDTSFEEQGDWSTSSAQTSLSSWALDGQGRTDASSWHAGMHLHEECGSVPDLPVAVNCTYSPLADATLSSPEINVPSSWEGAGVEFYIAGASEAGVDELEVTYTVGDEEKTIGTFSGEQTEWKKIGAKQNLNSAVGETVQFHFHFSSDELLEEGPGWFVDDFTLGGTPTDDLRKGDLLQSGGDGHGGHDHSH